MQLIIISGPSGSGKTTLSKKILENLKDGIILNTDNYYKTGVISQILSKSIHSYFDRTISFNYKLFRGDLEFILKEGFSKYSYDYNFKNKTLKKTYKKTNHIKFVIIEGIFGQEIIKSLSDNNCILVYLKINKQSCMKRVIKRDYEERGKSKNLAKKDFIKAWELFFKNKKKNRSKNYKLKIIVENKRDINSLLKNLTNIVN